MRLAALLILTGIALWWLRFHPRRWRDGPDLEPDFGAWDPWLEQAGR